MGHPRRLEFIREELIFVAASHQTGHKVNDLSSAYSGVNLLSFLLRYGTKFYE